MTATSVAPAWQMATFSALAHFRSLLLHGAEFTVRFEPFVIRSNLGSASVPAKVEGRVVRRVTSSAVYFGKPDGVETHFDFPPASEITMEGDSFVWTDDRGVRILSYTPKKPASEPVLEYILLTGRDAENDLRQMRFRGQGALAKARRSAIQLSTGPEDWVGTTAYAWDETGAEHDITRLLGLTAVAV